MPDDPAAPAPLQDRVPDSEKFEGVDKAIILLLIAVFLCLFVWLTRQPDLSLFTYWTFTALLTLVFVGVLRAAGLIRTGWLVLGGSAAVYVGLLWATTKAHDKYSSDRQEIARLQSEATDIMTQLGKVKAELGVYQEQDLKLVTFNGRKNAPFVKFMYSIPGSDWPAPYNKDEHCYFIPAKDVPRLEQIWVEFDDTAPGAAERQTSGDARRTIRIESWKLRPRPLQLDLHVSIIAGQV